MHIILSPDWARGGKNILYLLFGAASVSELENLNSDLKIDYNG